LCQLLEVFPNSAVKLRRGSGGNADKQLHEGALQGAALSGKEQGLPGV